LWRLVLAICPALLPSCCYSRRHLLVLLLRHVAVGSRTAPAGLLLLALLLCQLQQAQPTNTWLSTKWCMVGRCPLPSRPWAYQYYHVAVADTGLTPLPAVLPHPAAVLQPQASAGTAAEACTPRRLHHTRLPAAAAVGTAVPGTVGGTLRVPLPAVCTPQPVHGTAVLPLGCTAHTGHSTAGTAAGSVRTAAGNAVGTPAVSVLVPGCNPLQALPELCKQPGKLLVRCSLVLLWAAVGTAAASVLVPGCRRLPVGCSHLPRPHRQAGRLLVHCSQALLLAAVGCTAQLLLLALLLVEP
jgi:hypothetical protein